MAATNLKTNHSGINDMESVTIGDAAESLATAGATIPAKTTRIICKAGAALHWHPTGTPTATFGHAVAAGEIFVLEHSQLGAKIFSDDDNDQTVIVAYQGHNI